MRRLFAAVAGILLAAPALAQDKIERPRRDDAGLPPGIAAAAGPSKDAAPDPDRPTYFGPITFAVVGTGLALAIVCFPIRRPTD